MTLREKKTRLNFRFIDASELFKLERRERLTDEYETVLKETAPILRTAKEACKTYPDNSRSLIQLKALIDNFEEKYHDK